MLVVIAFNKVGDAFKEIANIQVSQQSVQRDLGAILGQILEEYAVGRERLEKDAREFVADLHGKKLISFVGEA